MKSETARKIGMAVCAIVMLIGVAALVVYVGGFGEKLASILPFGDNNTSEASTVPQDEPVFAESPLNGFNAQWLEWGADISDIQSAEAAMKKIKEQGFDTVVFSSCDNVVLASLVQSAKQNGLYTVALADAKGFSSSGAVDTAAVKALLSSGVESVMLDFRGGFSEREISNTAKALRKANKTVYLGIYALANADYQPVCAADIFDYKYVDITIPTASIEGDYVQFLNNYLDGTTRDTVFGIRAELLGNAKGYEEPDEIMAQLESIKQTNAFGFGIYRYGILEKNESLAKAVSEYMATGLIKDFFKELVVSKPANTSFKTDESVISFVGTADISMPLTLNGQAVEMIDDGYFSVEKKLKVGENVFAFSHKSQVITYKITYTPKLLKSVEPKESINAPGGTQLTIVAVAYKSASVKAVINGSSVALSRSDDYNDESEADVGSDYTYFVGSYTLPASSNEAKNLGKIKVTASYSGQSESLSGASVTVNAQEVEAPPVVEVDTTAGTTSQTPTTTQQPTDESESSGSEGSENSDSQQSTSATTAATTTTEKTTEERTELFDLLTPYKYNGVSGKSKMIVVKKAYGETLPVTPLDDVSVPYYTPLPEGTVDYVKTTASYSGINYYVLSSGRRVYQKDVEYLSSGYNMPANAIKTVSVKKTSDSTDITFTMKWKVPFNVREYPQSFYEQTKGRPYSVKAFTAEYIDIVFYYTTSADKAPQLSSSVIKRAEWIKSDSDKTQTLRLYLKKQGGFYGIKYYYNSDGTLTFSVKERASSAIAGKVIMLDAGHGGNDPGAIGTTIVGSKNIYEATINLAIANKMKSKLEALGATVIMTRTSADQTISLDARAASCRAKNPDVFVAVHCDASESQSPSGTTAYYYKSYSYPLAKYLNEGIVSAYKRTVYASNSTMANKVDKGSKFKGFRVTRVEECPSVLIEFGYVTNIVECKALSLDSNQNALAQGAVDGLVNYFKNS